MALETPGLSALRKKCNNLPLEPESRVLLVSSPLPEMAASAALLCRALRKAGLFFHITTGEPVMDSSTVAQTVDSHPDYTTILIGVETVQGSQKELETPSVVSIGVTPEKGKKSKTIGDRFNAPVTAYAIAVEKLVADTEEIQLALQGAILGSIEHERDSTTSELIAAGINSGMVQDSRGFLVFGMNMFSISEMLQFSVDPYIPGFSGNRSGCEKLIDQSGIPLSMRSSPLARLSTEDKQKVIQNLVGQLPQEVLNRVLGENYEFPYEKKDSPVRFSSQIRTLIGTAWTRQQTGLALGVLMGDRARALRNLVDLCIQHSQLVIDGVRGLVTRVGEDLGNPSDSVTVLPLSLASKESLPDLARVMIENGHVKSRFTMVVSEDSVGISWARGLVDLNRVLVTLRGIGLRPVSTSVASLRIDDCSEDSVEPIRKALETVSDGKSAG